MAKNSHHKFSGMPLENEHHQGCMWGIFHVLGLHQWHSVKKMLPHKRHGGERRAGGIKTSRMRLNIPDTGEAQGFIGSDMDDSLIQEKMIDACRISRKPRKACMKDLISEEMSKEEVQKHCFSSIPSRFMRTDSIHHLEPSHHDLPDEVRVDGGSPSINLHQDAAKIPSTSTQDPLLLKSLGESINSFKLGELCSTMSTSKRLGHSDINELEWQLLMNHALQKKLDKAKESLSKQKSMDAKELHEHVALHHSKDFLNALELFSVNKELFLKILQDPGCALEHDFPGLQVSNVKRGLTKSGSFPLPDFSGRKNIRPTKLKYKQKEIELFAKQEGMQARNQPSMLTTDKSSEVINAQSTPLVVDDSSGSVLNPDHESLEGGETGSDLDSSRGHFHELRKQGKNRVVVNRFKDIKQRIKHAFKESRKEGQRISKDAILHKIPHGQMFSKDAKREMTGQWKELSVDRDGKGSPRSGYESDISVSPLGKGRLHHLRTPSLDGSLDRYSQLYDSSFGREAKRNISNRLKLTNEDGGSPFSRPSTALGRILSLPDLESYCSLQSEVSGNALCSGTLTGVLEDSNTSIKNVSFNEQKPVVLPIQTENCRQLDAFVESGNLENLVELGASDLFDRDQTGSSSTYTGNAIMCEKIDDLDNLANGEGSSVSQYENEIGPPNNASSLLGQPGLICDFDSCFEEDRNSPVKFSISEGPELKTRPIHLGDLDSLVNLQDQSVTDSIIEAESTLNFKNMKILSNHFDNDFPQVQVDRTVEADFNYVRDVLKLSGFSGEGYLGTWHSPDQPVDPSLFEEVEACSPLKPNYAGGEFGSNYDHLLLFDIINEVLLEIYERSFTYWPLPLSCNCHIRPMPMRYHVLEEVWASVRWYLSSQPELESSLDYVVARDLSKGDEWMNLQFDSECVGLELEEMILDDLLEEVIYT